MFNFDIDLGALKQAIDDIKAAGEGFDDQITEIINNLDVVPLSFDMGLGAKDVISIDGSYLSLWQYPHVPIWLVWIRTSIVHRRYDPVNMKYDVLLDDVRDKFEVIDFVNNIKYVNGSKFIMNDDETNFKDINTFNGYESIKAEREVTLEMAKKYKDHLIFYDGAISGYPYTAYNVQFSRSYEESQRVIKEIMNTCRENENIIVGISKDSNLKNINGKTRDEDLLQFYSYMNPSETGYYMIDEGITTDVGVCFARLNRDAIKWFRVDFMVTEIAPLPKILESIAKYSQVNLMPGSPVPPLQAHDVAVEARQLKDYVDSIVMESLFDAGFSEMEILKGLTDISGNLIEGTHHDFLDYFTKVSRHQP